MLVEDGHVADAALGQPAIAIQLDAQEPALLLRLLACTPRPTSRIGTPRQREGLMIQSESVNSRWPANGLALPRQTGPHSHVRALRR